MFSGLSLSARIYGSFGALIMLLITVAGVGYLGAQTIASTLQEYRAAARQSLEINDYVYDLSEMRRTATAYRLEPSEQAAQAVRLMIEDVATFDQEGLAKFEGNQSALDSLHEAAEQAVTYGQAFDQLVAAHQRNDIPAVRASEAQMDSIGPSMQAIFDSVATAAEDQQNQLGPLANQQAQNTMLLVLIMGAGAALIAMVLAFATGRWLSGSIARITATMRRGRRLYAMHCKPKSRRLLPLRFRGISRRASPKAMASQALMPLPEA